MNSALVGILGLIWLFAALTLIVITAYLVGRNKPTGYTLVPAILMLVTTVASLMWQSYTFILVKKNLLLGTVALILVILALIVAGETVQVIRKKITCRYG